MHPWRQVLLPALVFLLSFAAAFSADNVSSQQKATAAANLKSVEFNNATIVETNSLFVCTALTETKAKTFAEGLEKVHAVARKALQYATDEQPWKGKLTVYVIDDRKKFSLFMLQVAQAKPKETLHIDVRGDTPFVVKGIEVGRKPTEAETTNETGQLVAGALLTSRAGSTAEVPEWVRVGFSKAVLARNAGPTSRAMTDLKNKSKAAVQGRNRPPAKVEDAWSGNDDGDVIAASLMDYIAFGPGSANFTKFLNGFRPSESTPMPTIDSALAAASWKKEDLDKAWKKYVMTGK